MAGERLQRLKIWRISAALAGLLAGAAVGCAPTRVPPIGSDAPPESLANESELWSMSRRWDDRLSQSGAVYEDEALEAYLNRIAHRLLDRPEVRIHVLRNPRLNAFALPNGSLYLTTGILARMENEAQLATLLGHELNHFERRHALEERGRLENTRTGKTAVVGILGLAFLWAGVDPMIPDEIVDLTTPVMDSVIHALESGYAPESEREADRLGLRSVVEAGYDARESTKLFENLMLEDEAPRIEDPSFYANRARLSQRIESYRALIRTSAAAGSATGEAAFFEATAALLLANVGLDLEAGRLASASSAIQRYLQRRP